MSRLAFPAILLLALPATVAAQPASVSGFGGGFVRPLPPGSVRPPVGPQPLRYTGGFLGGFVQPGYTNPGFPFSGVWGGFGYGGGFGYNNWFPYYSYPAPLYTTPVPVAVRPPAPPRSEPVITLANEFPATLALELPAVAEVWVNGKKAEGSAAAEWTLTSPVLKAGESYTFEIKARWDAGGKTYEAVRSVSVAGGQRSKSLVVAGTQVKE